MVRWSVLLITKYMHITFFCIAYQVIFKGDKLYFFKRNITYLPWKLLSSYSKFKGDQQDSHRLPNDGQGEEKCLKIQNKFSWSIVFRLTENKSEVIIICLVQAWKCSSMNLTSACIKITIINQKLLISKCFTAIISLNQQNMKMSKWYGPCCDKTCLQGVSHKVGVKPACTATETS